MYEEEDNRVVPNSNFQAAIDASSIPIDPSNGPLTTVHSKDPGRIIDEHTTLAVYTLI